MHPQELPLMLASSLVRAPSEPFPLDRVRMQKAVFLLVQRGSDGWRHLYDYTPYNWGPYSRDLTVDVDDLASKHLMATEVVQGSQYGRYVTTPAGDHAASASWVHLSLVEQQFLKQVRSYVTSRSFNDLLREVYAAYPQFATESRFTG
ncbi:hypothetical protein GCM10009789_14560 [Kribbella sancticallisti]|uniref:Uncharacterized protein n=1 Tax=Kribbella sancticallisti TaxID=460087 RepID=A0ABP4NIN7_9ACTN